MSYNFFAMYGRMKYINRWALPENCDGSGAAAVCVG